MTKKERFEKACECIVRIKSGQEEFIPELWVVILPETKNIAKGFISNKSGTRLYDIDDIINESYFALLDAVNRTNFNKGSINDLYEFFGLYKLCVRSHTTKIRATYRKNDPMRITTSLDEMFGYCGGQEENDGNLGDIIPDENSEKSFEEIIERGYLYDLQTALSFLSRYLSEDERQVIRSKYYHNKDYEQISRELNWSKSRIRYLEIKALYKYRAHAKEVDLEVFL